VRKKHSAIAAYFPFPVAPPSLRGRFFLALYEAGFIHLLFTHTVIVFCRKTIFSAFMTFGVTFNFPEAILFA